ncbi:hypothetical protein ACWGPW_02785 [Paenibacillus chitinolyticus]
MARTTDPILSISGSFKASTLISKSENFRPSHEYGKIYWKVKTSGFNNKRRKFDEAQHWATAVRNRTGPDLTKARNLLPAYAAEPGFLAALAYNFNREDKRMTFAEHFI